MGVLADIVELLKTSNINSETISKNLLDHSMKKTSISKMSSDGICQFPILVSKSIDIETAQTITKAIERNYASFIAIYVSVNGTIDMSNGVVTVSEYIKKNIHQNETVGLFDSSGLSKYIQESLDALIDPYLYDGIITEGGVILVYSLFEDDTNILVAANKDQLFDVLEHVQLDKLNDKFKPTRDFVYNMKDKNTSAVLNELYIDPALDNARDRGEQHRQKKFNESLAKGGNNTNDKFKFTELLLDNDIKKANELVPSMLHLRVTAYSQDGNLQPIDFAIGVKGMMHPIKSEDMITNLISSVKTNSKAFNFIRWSSGEISFFKDFLFNIQDTKNDIANKYSGMSSSWWIALKRRKAMYNINSILGKRIMPNSTIVVSADEVEYIKVNYGYDLSNSFFVNKIMESYFLLGFVIVDMSGQIAHFMFDGRSEFESVSFSGLEKENSNSERKFKDMLKVINRN